MVKIGMVIGDRYEVLEKVGTGGMSDVYKAKDQKLNRFVAVKVLKQEFSENTNFVSKFQTEAQAAAGLMHPNIVNVYDVGEENGIHYIVMELVDGITLKKYIEKKARLSYKEAVSIAIQVSMGIEAAHNNHIIHRDIKPQNIIISKDGKVKVTDFGIAKAATSNTITSNVMGSVHYTSPEQARGGYSDAKSDIYSLGVTMFEMLTGRVPFNGETTVAIAIKHIQEEMPSPKEFVQEIPNSVESIVLKCCQKSPDRRYQSMAELIADLKQSLMSPDEDFVVMSNPEMEGGTRPITESEMAQIKQKSHTNLEAAYVEREHSPQRQEAMEQEYEEAEDYDEEDEPYEEESRMERVTTVLTIVAGIIILVIILILALKLLENNTSGITAESVGPIITEESSRETSQPASETEEESVMMPDVTGMALEDARNTLTGLGLFADVEYQESDTIDEGVVISASVNEKESLEPGASVVLYVSSGTQGVVVENVQGRSTEEATRRLTNLGFAVNKTESYSETVAKGVVISQSPAGDTKAPKGSAVTLTVSLGKEQQKVQVPKLVGLSVEEGTAIIWESDLVVGSTVGVYSAEFEADEICYQSYSQGTYVDPGTEIDIKYSLGKEKVTYKCNISIAAPSAAEAPDYTSGTEVSIKFETDDGKVLQETKTTTFPQAANYYGLTSSGGTITMTYMGIPAAEAEGGIQAEEGTLVEKSFTRRVEFTQE